MLFLLRYLIPIALIVAVAVWFADHPGRVAVTWEGYQLVTSVAVMTLALALAIATGMGLIGLGRWLRRAPRAMGRRRQDKRHRNGYLALTHGLTAIAIGDAEEAARQAKRARNLLKEPALTLPLAAQAAELSGDDAAAARAYEEMLENPEAELSGLRGLLDQARRNNDKARALELARRARALRPQAAWALIALLELETENQNWEEAQALLDAAINHRAIDGTLARHWQAVVLTERARQVRTQGHHDEAVELARRAHAAEPGFAPAALYLATLLQEQGKERKAATVLEKSWTVAPHPDYATLYAGLDGNPDPTHKLRQVEKLADMRPGHPESYFAVAEAALAAKLWGEARSHLEKLAALAPTARVYRLLADVEERSRGDGAAVRAHLLKATESAPDPVWSCGKCGHVSVVWSAACPACAAFDGLSWRAIGARLPAVVGEA